MRRKARESKVERILRLIASPKMLRTSTVCCKLPPSSPLKGLKFFFKNFFCPGSRTGAGGAPGDSRENHSLFFLDRELFCVFFWI